MGASTKTLDRLRALGANGHIGQGSRMIELGAQNLHCGGGAADLKGFVESFTGRPCQLSDEECEALVAGGMMSKVARSCGMDYIALDIFDYEATILFDLNSDAVPDDMVGQFDLVTNLGTTEHIIGQHNAMRVMHDLAKVGGILYHDLPMGGYFYHGYFSYNPLYFHHIAAANGYEIVFRHFSKVPANSPYLHEASEELKAHGWPDAGYHDIGIEFIFRKMRDEPFATPIEIGTSHGVDEEFIRNRGGSVKVMSGMNIPDKN